MVKIVFLVLVLLKLLIAICWLTSDIMRGSIALVAYMPRPYIVRKHRTGERVPETGIYTVTHQHHRLQHQVIILKDEKFPRCAKCSNAVFFELVYPAPGLFESAFIRVYELPEVEEA